MLPSVKRRNFKYIRLYCAQANAIKQAYIPLPLHATLMWWLLLRLHNHATIGEIIILHFCRTTDVFSALNLTDTLLCRKRKIVKVISDGLGSAPICQVAEVCHVRCGIVAVTRNLCRLSTRAEGDVPHHQRRSRARVLALLRATTYLLLLLLLVYCSFQADRWSTYLRTRSSCSPATRRIAPQTQIQLEVFPSLTRCSSCRVVL